MTETIITALIAGLSVAIPSVVATLSSNKQNHNLMAYRIDKLEEKVDKHNQVVERMALVERDLKTAFQRIDELKKDSKK